ncbi:MAG: 50S ribosomal protein L15 [Alphaproteobacteria bacterium]|nr:50S ribosomal protein L15 [Alphaproteobacteria bacterium]
MKLNEFGKTPGTLKNRKRIGRGIGSGTGKTGGRGVKGQKSRSGVAIRGFEGGQMPLYRRLPKRGFSNSVFASKPSITNIDRLQDAIARGKIDASATITDEVLINAGLASKAKAGVRLLARGEASMALTIEISSASDAAVVAIAQAGGTVTQTRPKDPKAANADSPEGGA